MGKNVMPRSAIQLSAPPMRERSALDRWPCFMPKHLFNAVGHRGTGRELSGLISETRVIVGCHWPFTWHNESGPIFSLGLVDYGKNILKL